MYYNILSCVIAADKGYTTPTFDPGSPYILVVDDDEPVLSVVMKLLEIEGHAGLGFCDSQKVLPFLEHVRASREKPTRLPSVILIDLMMPGISGYEIISWLAGYEWSAHIPIVIMSADPSALEANAMRGVADWVSKPFQVDVLLAKLERYLPLPLRV